MVIQSHRDKTTADTMMSDDALTTLETIDASLAVILLLW